MSLIDFIHGAVIERGPDYAVLSAGAFGVRVLASSATVEALPQVGAEALIYTHLQVREDALTLYGFATREERALFNQLTSVTGVGPKVALGALSALPAERLAAVIAAGDVDALARVPGIGKKTASRIVLDLKGKLVVPESGQPTAPVAPPQPPVFDTVAAALREFGGLSPQEVAAVLATLPTDRELSEEEAISLAFRSMSARR